VVAENDLVILGSGSLARSVSYSLATVCFAESTVTVVSRTPSSSAEVCYVANVRAALTGMPVRFRPASLEHYSADSIFSEHLEPRQPRVIPPPRTRPRTALDLLPAAPIPAVTGTRIIIIIIIAAAARSRAGLLRRPPEQHPLQHRDSGIRLGQLISLPGSQLPQLRVLPGQLIDSRRLPINDSQRPRQQLLRGRPAGGRRPGTIPVRQNPSRRSHEPQQTLSLFHPGCSGLVTVW
jgi:hypothetical protein